MTCKSEVLTYKESHNYGGTYNLIFTISLFPFLSLQRRAERVWGVDEQYSKTQSLVEKRAADLNKED